MNTSIFEKISKYLRAEACSSQKRSESHSKFFEVIRGQNVFFSVGGTCPPKGDPEFRQDGCVL